MRYVEKFSRTGKATDDNNPQAHYMLDNKSYRLKMCNNHCFLAVTMVARTPQYHVYKYNNRCLVRLRLSFVIPSLT